MKMHFLVGISKKTICIIHQNGWRITRGMQPEGKMSHLESYCYNESDPGPKALASLNLDERKSFLVCFEARLTFLSSDVYHPVPIKCTPWFTSIIGLFFIVSCVPPLAIISG
jgi:hypothetical protein